ncbi:MAG: biotin transporter BioY, partial [Haloechinothrix sp.]
LMAAGNLVIYLIGVPVRALVAHIDPPTAITMGALVFIPWDGLKIAIAAGLLPFAWRLAGDRRGG